MAYGDFALWYDLLNTNANYAILADKIIHHLHAAGIRDGIVADLGCGTGTLTLRLAEAGYDMLAVDASSEMLSVLQDKISNHDTNNESGGTADILLLCQRLEELDLYGTIRAAVAMFDTFNHLPPAVLTAALGRISLFMEPNGLLLFDMNSIYKHYKILGNNTYTLDVPEESAFYCEWQNHYDPRTKSVHMELCGVLDDQTVFTESIYEYGYHIKQIRHLLTDNGFEIQSMWDGETFGKLTPHSARIFVVARKSDL